MEWQEICMIDSPLDPTIIRFSSTKRWGQRYCGMHDTGASRSVIGPDAAAAMVAENKQCKLMPCSPITFKVANGETVQVNLQLVCPLYLFEGKHHTLAKTDCPMSQRGWPFYVMNLGGRHSRDAIFGRDAIQYFGMQRLVGRVGTSGITDDHVPLDDPPVSSPKKVIPKVKIVTARTGAQLSTGNLAEFTNYMNGKSPALLWIVCCAEAMLLRSFHHCLSTHLGQKTTAGTLFCLSHGTTFGDRSDHSGLMKRTSPFLKLLFFIEKKSTPTDPLSFASFVKYLGH